ncbi:MOSC domain-containing protein [Venturia nashicola]|uniref:MOSC domain-containing protein n=1 Tax=Venturia nashicola TaxID=86259 RepID=A0A4Z1P1F8_9PEZI|nr:MOSC domain-containing protein [Venturia nashicola]TLD35291.1 MOSC domain-containing protein [Venturia nashicola]
MKITQLYIYPIKSLRPTPVTSAIATKTGFTYDRRFMLLKRLDDGTYQNMLVSGFPEMTLFLTSIKFPSSKSAADGEVTVTFSPPEGEKKTIIVPLVPDVAELERVDVNMHSSPTQAKNMGEKYNDWFSSCFGFPVVFVYVGEGRRPVLFANPAKAQPATSSSWLSSLTSSILGSNKENGPGDGKREIAFQDCAHFLVVTEESLESVSDRLPEGEEMDVTKFRPNIVLSGADQAWDEDFWGEVTFGNGDGGLKIELQHNCVRCKSVNVDYQTGKPGTGKAGEVLKLMQSDRRVDKLKKYSPVFGRYGFLTAGNGEEITLGSEVSVTKRNKERSGFDWPL